MAFSTSTIQPINKPAVEKPVENNYATSLLSMIVLSVYAAHKSKKAFRKLKRKFLWTAFKLKAKSMFSKRAEGLSRNVILYIILGVLILALLIISPIAALVLAIIGLILILTGKI
ncbi:MAG TPA: hypothetical protein VGO09_01200 [Flavisolibacter sp.]|nr:hypothetical protein [Flavisolibacter sp.]